VLVSRDCCRRQTPGLAPHPREQRFTAAYDQAVNSTAAAALAIFAAVFAIATLRGVHIGLLMFVAACLVGTTVGGMTLREVIAGFPVNILILVAGVTFFFGMARMNGTIDLVLGAMLPRKRGRSAAVPVAFFGVATVMSAMGSPQAGLATGPMGMSTVRQARVDPVLMAIAINAGISAGSFAPTSLFGIITYQVALRAGIDMNAFALFAVAVVANVALLAGALIIFRAPSPATLEDTPIVMTSVPHSLAAAAAHERQLTGHQLATIVSLLGVVAATAVSAVAGLEVDIGVLLLGLGALLALFDPSRGGQAFTRIDWSTAFVVGGIVTYVAVLQKLDAVTILGREVMAIGSPIVAALFICIVAALVSAFASTTGVLAALIPMAVPLAVSGAIPGWVLITTLGISATIVDGSPFSNTGATLVASAAEGDRARLRAVLLRWSMALVVVGPIVLLPLLLVVGLWSNG
jgi:di/tricarboxylate transporter